MTYERNFSCEFLVRVSWTENLGRLSWALHNSELHAGRVDPLVGSENLQILAGQVDNCLLLFTLYTQWRSQEIFPGGSKSRGSGGQKSRGITQLLGQEFVECGIFD